jgi:hypothetical protein
MSPDPFPNLVEKLGDNLYLSPEVVQWLEVKGCFYASYVDEALCAYIKKEKDNERRAARRGRMVGKAVSAAS